MDWEAHRQRMLEHFLLMHSLDPAYAKWALKRYATMPNSPNPDMVEVVRAEWRRRKPTPSPMPPLSAPSS